MPKKENLFSEEEKINFIQEGGRKSEKATNIPEGHL
jgi:hypothetical protein